MILETLENVLASNGLITAFMFVGALVWLSYLISAKLTRGQVHGSAIAIALGLVLAWWGGFTTGGSRGLSDIPLLAGVGVLGGSMFRDFAIVATAFGADVRALKGAGAVGALSIVRFRTPIREPEDLGFLFLAVAAGVGLGANQTVAVVIAFTLILAVLAGIFWFRAQKSGPQTGVFVNVVIPFEDAPGSALDRLSQEISSFGRNVEVRRVEINEKRITAIYTVLADDLDSLSSLTNGIEAAFSGARVSIVNDFE